MLHNGLTGRRSPRKGAVAILVALCLTVMLSVVAVAVDAGLALHYRRRSQSTADAIAMAAAIELGNGHTVNQAQSAGMTTASTNGYNNDGQTNKVVINI